AVTGTVGRGGLAAWQLRRRPEPRRHRLRALLDLHARVAEGRGLAPRVHALLDSSDGLFGALHLLSAASRVAILLEEETIPFHPDLLSEVPGWADRLRIAGFGGDYELVAALDPRAERAARAAVAAVGGTLTVVGRVASGRGAVLQRRDGRRERLPPAGWDPFDPSGP
ncbi:MAG: AIR synthase-related protein, partial [Thermoplasmata archaeon]